MMSEDLAVRSLSDADATSDTAASRVASISSWIVVLARGES